MKFAAIFYSVLESRTSLAILCTSKYVKRYLEHFLHACHNDITGFCGIRLQLE